jgi:hypothetical protein
VGRIRDRRSDHAHRVRADEAAQLNTFARSRSLSAALSPVVSSWSSRNQLAASSHSLVTGYMIERHIESDLEGSFTARGLGEQQTSLNIANLS